MNQMVGLHLIRSDRTDAYVRTAFDCLEALMTSRHKVCIIGAGCSGITTAKRLKDHGIDYDQFEMSDDVGGNWYFRNPNGRSAVYESLHIDTSKTRLQFEEFPVPEDWPDFPSHRLMHDYFRDYVDHFGLRDGIEFGVGVERAARTPDGAGTSRCRPARPAPTPTWSSPTATTGSRGCPTTRVTFDGVLMHSHAYVSPFEPVEIRGKRVVVVGMGNSAMDIASELSSPWMASTLYVSARRGVWVLPKYRNGQPADKVMAPPDIPKDVALAASRELIRGLVGKMQRLRPARAGPRAAGGAPVGVGGLPDQGRLGRHPHAAGDLAARRARRSPGRRLVGRGGRDHLRDRLRDVVPVLRPRPSRPAPRRRAPLPAVQADDQAGRRPPVLHGAGPVVPDDRQPGRAAVQAARQAPRRDLRAALGRGAGARSCAPTRRSTSSSTTPRRGTRSRSTSAATASTCTRRSRRARSGPVTAAVEAAPPPFRHRRAVR